MPAPFVCGTAGGNGFMGVAANQNFFVFLGPTIIDTVGVAGQIAYMGNILVENGFERTYETGKKFRAPTVFA